MSEANSQPVVGGEQSSLLPDLHKSQPTLFERVEHAVGEAVAETLEEVAKYPTPLTVAASAGSSSSSADLIAISSQETSSAPSAVPSKIDPVPQPAADKRATIFGFQRRWVVLAVCTTGGLLASVQSNALLIAFAVLLENLDCDLSTLLWVILAFQLVVTSLVNGIGKLADALGRAFLFKIGFCVFVLAALLCGCSQAKYHGYDLVGYRVVMGIGAGILFTNSMAIVADEFMPFQQMGIAQGIFQLSMAMGSVLGPVVGGVLADADWRWVFWINLIPGGIASLIAVFYIHDRPKPAGSPTTKELLKQFDTIGCFFNVAYISLAMVLLTQVVLPDKNLNTTAGLTATSIVCVICFILFVVRQKTAQYPLVPLDIFKSRLFNASVIAQVCISFARNNTIFILIFFLQGPYLQDPLEAGVSMIPFGVGILLTAIVAGAISDRVGVRIPWSLGALTVFGGVIGLGFIQPYTNYWVIAAIIFIIGLGVGLFNAPSSAALMSSVTPQRRATAAGISMMASLAPAMIGIVLVFKLVLTSMPQEQILNLFILGQPVQGDQLDPFMKAIQDVCWITAAVAFVAIPLALCVPKGFTINAPKPAAAPPATAIASETRTTSSSVTADGPRTEKPSESVERTVLSNGHDHKVNDFADKAPEVEMEIIAPRDEEAAT